MNEFQAEGMQGQRPWGERSTSMADKPWGVWGQAEQWTRSETRLDHAPQDLKGHRGSYPCPWSELGSCRRPGAGE